jgi:Protein of unknown function (DUF1638)
MGRTTDRLNGARPNLILACGALAREIIILSKQVGVGAGGLKLHCLPATLHNRPAEIAPRVDAYLSEHRAAYDRVLVGYGDCGTGGALDKVLLKHDAQRLPHAHCYEFFATAVVFSEITEAEIGSFFVTDFLVRHFDRLVMEGLGLDRMPHLRDAYFGNYRDLVYLAQTETPSLQAKAREAAEKLDLNYVYRLVGFGDLAAAVTDIAGTATDVIDV